MRHLFKLAILVMAMMATPVGADDRNFTLVNATGYAIKFVGVNPPGDNNWDENELSGIFRNGARIDIKFTGADRGCVWNLRVVWVEDDSASLFRNLNLCEINVVTLRYNRATDTASYTTE
jgi:hypothetical protein